MHVDPRRLLPGTVHYAEVVGYECIQAEAEAAAAAAAPWAVSVLEGMEEVEGECDGVLYII